MKNSWMSFSQFSKESDYGGGFAGRMMKMWKQKLASLEDDLKTSLVDSAWECKDNIRQLCLNLLDKLRDLEHHFLYKSQQDLDVKDNLFMDAWKASISEWKREVYEIKCELKLYLKNLIKKHCDFLTNLDQFHPEYIKWKISRIIVETNKIILANEKAYENTELGLMQKASLFTRTKYLENLKTDETDAIDTDAEPHDAINVNYDDFEREEEKKRRGELLIEQIEEVRTDTTLTAMLEWIDNIRTLLTEPLPMFNNYDSWNQKLEIAIDHLENSKNLVMNSAIEFLESVEIHLRDELLGMKQPKIDLSPEDRNAIERWVECLSFFEFSAKNTIAMIRLGGSIWNQHVCRLDTVRQLIQKIMRELLIKQNNHQIKIEQKINVLFDSIREAPSREVIDICVKDINKHFVELEKLYSRIYASGLQEIKDFSVGCRLARLVFVNHATFCHLRDVEQSGFPDHGSELDIGFESITELHHWEIIKQSFNAYSNWNSGFLEGFNLLCQFEKKKEGWEILWEEGLTKQISWIRSTKEQALKRRKERFHANLVMPRIKELEAHDAILLSHVLGLQKIFGEKLDWINEFKCSLLVMNHKLQREYSAIVNYKNLNDVYSRSRFLGRINKFEMELKKTDEIKSLTLDYEVERVKKKMIWLHRANNKILTYVRLFNEGGSFSSLEALIFSDKVKLLQSYIESEEAVTLESLVSAARSINPTKNIDNKLLNSIKHMVYYKTKKISVDEMADTILAKLKEAIRVELVTAKNYGSELCDIIGCSEVPLTSLQALLAKFAQYLQVPIESSQLECEDFDYIGDMMDESVRKVEDKKQEEETEPDEEVSDDKKDCAQLLEEYESTRDPGETTSLENLEINFDSLKTRKWTKSNLTKDALERGKEDRRNKDTDDNGSLSNGDKEKPAEAPPEFSFSSVKRKDVLRDTKCEQRRRLKEIQEKVKQKGQEESAATPPDHLDKNQEQGRDRTRSIKRASKNKIKRTSKPKPNPQITKKISVNLKYKDDKKTTVNDKDDEPVEDTDIMPDFAGDYLFKYTQVPIEMTSCNYLLLTKRIIFEHFVQIQKISEKFYLTHQPHDIKKVWHEFSPKRDFKALTSRVLKDLRILNIYCEHSWLLLVHDFLCMTRALHCVTEERVDKEMDGMELKWNTDFGRICSDSEALLKHVVQDKIIRAARLLDKHSFTSCDRQEDWLIVQEDMKSHCNQHVEDIRNIWTNYTRALSERYLEYKKNVLNLMKKTEDTRKVIGSDKKLRAFFKGLQTFAARFEKTIKLFYEKEGITEQMEGEYKQTAVTEQNNQKNKNNEIQKIKLFQLLLQVITAVIDNFEKNYIKTKAKKGHLLSVSVVSRALSSNKVDIEARRNLFLPKMIRTIKFKHECFRRICSDQISITNSWHENWQMKNLDAAKT